MERRRVELAEAIRAARMSEPAFRAGFDATVAWGDGRVGDPRPVNPHAPGSPEAARWQLGAEQAELEMGSPDSWRDGGAGMDLGVLREVWTIEQGVNGGAREPGATVDPTTTRIVDDPQGEGRGGS